MQEAAVLISALVQFAWLILAGGTLYGFREPVAGLLKKLSKFRLRLPNGTEIDVSAHEAAEIAQELLNEVDQLIEDITSEESAILARVLKSPRTLSVIEMFPSFKRPSKELDILRRLRDKQLIRPVEGGQWLSDKHIEIKPFGRILLKVRRERLVDPQNDESSNKAKQNDDEVETAPQTPLGRSPEPQLPPQS